MVVHYFPLKNWRVSFGWKAERELELDTKKEEKGEGDVFTWIFFYSFVSIGILQTKDTVEKGFWCEWVGR